MVRNDYFCKMEFTVPSDKPLEGGLPVRLAWLPQLCAGSREFK
jgi:hypothetical protein